MCSTSFLCPAINVPSVTTPLAAVHMSNIMLKILVSVIIVHGLRCFRFTYFLTTNKPDPYLIVSLHLLLLYRFEVNLIFFVGTYTDGAHTRTEHPNIKEVVRLNCSSQLLFLISLIAFNKYINSKHRLF